MMKYQLPHHTVKQLFSDWPVFSFIFGLSCKPLLLQGFKNLNAENNKFQKNLYLDWIQIEILWCHFGVILLTHQGCIAVNKRLTILEDFHIDVTLGICLDIHQQWVQTSYSMVGVIIELTVIHDLTQTGVLVIQLLT